MADAGDLLMCNFCVCGLNEGVAEFPDIGVDGRPEDPEDQEEDVRNHTEPG